MKSGKVTPDSSSSSSKKSPLPLGWTQIKRGRKRQRSSAKDEFEIYCCEDESCPIDNRKTAPVLEKHTSSDTQPENDQTLALKGKALFCLHALDCSWFQGQFVNEQKSASIKSLGLLAKQRKDLDECLQCGDGGYREIDLTILRRRNSNDRESERKSIVLEKLTCTGGDMLHIRTPSHDPDAGWKPTEAGITKMTSFDAERIITGKRVDPLVRKYFLNLLPPCRRDAPVLDQLPDCAVVIGSMSMELPKSFLCEKKLRKEEDDGWLE